MQLTVRRDDEVLHAIQRTGSFDRLHQELIEALERRLPEFGTTCVRAMHENAASEPNQVCQCVLGLVQLEDPHSRPGDHEDHGHRVGDQVLEEGLILP